MRGYGTSYSFAPFQAFIYHAVRRKATSGGNPFCHLIAPAGSAARLSYCGLSRCLA